MNVDWDGPWSMRVRAAQSRHADLFKQFHAIVGCSWTVEERVRLSSQFDWWWARLYG